MEISEILGGSIVPETNPRSDELGQQDFLRMLIAQLENQDPLDPQDATEFTAQLAQFSSLDQLVNMRQAIDSLSTTSGLSDGLAVAGLIGKSALVESNAFAIAPAGEFPTLGLDLPGAAEILSVEVKSESGSTVARAAGLGLLQAGTKELDWSNFDRVPPPGSYSLHVTVAPGDPTPKTLVRSEVKGAALDASGTVLLFSDFEAPLSSLRQIGTELKQQS
jgi:flagellar basal-body rod modification protein FlgD